MARNEWHPITEIANQPESYFIEKSFIDERERLSVEEILSRTQAYISNLEISPKEADEFLKSIIDGN